MYETMELVGFIQAMVALSWFLTLLGVVIAMSTLSGIARQKGFKDTTTLWIVALLLPIGIGVIVAALIVNAIPDKTVTASPAPATSIPVTDGPAGLPSI